MKNIYYLIWSDAIYRIRKHHPHKKNWKISLFIYITWIHALNLFIVFLWLKYFNIHIIPALDFDIFPGTILDDFFSFSVKFALFPVIINYFLVFHKNRYERLTLRYPKSEIMYSLIYSMTVLIGAFISAVIYGVLS